MARAREHHARVGRGPGRGQAGKVQLDYPGRRAQGTGRKYATLVRAAGWQLQRDRPLQSYARIRMLRPGAMLPKNPYPRITLEFGEL